LSNTVGGFPKGTFWETADSDTKMIKKPRKTASIFYQIGTFPASLLAPQAARQRSGAVTVNLL